MENVRKTRGKKYPREKSKSIYDQLEEVGRLEATDKPIFARNLGRLAERISPDKPIDGAHRIVLHAGNENLWPTKRKKYFRFSNEEAPPATKGQEYASSPRQFRRLAEAAGELLCKAQDPDALEKSKRSALDTLLTGSSFVAGQVPLDTATLSAKELLDEYRRTLSTAIQSRTQIVKLWEILDRSSIGIRHDNGYVSPFGEAAVVPWGPKGAFFVPQGDVLWSWVDLDIGWLDIPLSINMFPIPRDKQYLFRDLNRYVSDEAIEWLKSVDFKIGKEEQIFPTTAKCKNIKAHVIIKVTMFCTPDYDFNPLLELSVDEFNKRIFFETKPDHNEDYHTILFDHLLNHDDKFGQSWNFKIKNINSGIYVIYDDYIIRPLREGFTEANPIGILPSNWDDGNYFIGSNYDNWINRNTIFDDRDIEIFDDLQFGDWGWTEFDYLADFLLGRSEKQGEGLGKRRVTDGANFLSSLPDAEPIGGVMQAGSIGASLLHNARYAAPENRLTNKLIDKADLIAKAGLRFYQAMIEDARDAIARI